MSFVAYIFLWSLGLLSIPVLIALWNRKRKRKIKFGGYYLLRKIAESSRRRIQILQLLKLLNRLILVSAIIFIFAEPQRPKEVLKNASDGFAIFLDAGRVMQAKGLANAQLERLRETLVRMPSASKGIVVTFGAKCRSLRLEDGRSTAGAEDWVASLGDLEIPYTIESTTSSGLSDCLARANSLFEGKSYLKVLISPLPASLDAKSIVESSFQVEKLSGPQVSFVERPQLREDESSEQVKISGFDARTVTLIRPPERSISYGEVTGDLELPLSQESWLLVERPQSNDPWEGSTLFSLQYEPQREIALWTAKETEGYQSLLTALRAHPRLKVIREVGAKPSGDAVILYGGYDGELDKFKKVWIFQSNDNPSSFPIRDQKTWSSMSNSADLRRSFLIKSDSGNIFVKRYVLFDTDSFATLESFEDGAPSLLQADTLSNVVWLTPFDLEDLTTDLSLEPSFIPYLYQKLDRWLGTGSELQDGVESEALWLMKGNTPASAEVVRDQLWPGIYKTGSRWQTVEAGAFPLQFLSIDNLERNSETTIEQVSLRQLMIKILAICILIELVLCFLSAKFGWLIVGLVVIGSASGVLRAAEVMEKVPIGVIEGTNPDRLTSLKQLIRDSVFLSNLELAPPEVVTPERFWKYSVVFSSGSTLPNWNESQRGKIREYLEKGGLIFFDDPLGTLNSSFRANVQEEIQKIFPGRSLEPISSEDVIYRTYYLLSEVSGRRLASPTLDGLKLDSRWVVVFSSNDLLGAILRGSGGDYQLSVTPYGIMQRHLSHRLLMNILFYSLTIDYKDDAIHLPHILKRRSR